jgi:hypothetical protein
MIEDAGNREAFEGRLSDDERLLWTGRPDPNALFGIADYFLVPFSLLWGGFAFAWEALVIVALLRGEERSANGGSLWFFAVFGVIFVITGVYLIAGRFVYKRARNRRTRYAVTDRRVLSVIRLFGEHSQAEQLDGIASLSKSVASSGCGSIFFGDVPPWSRTYANTGMDLFGPRQTRMPVAFFDVRDIDAVYRQVSELLLARDGIT